MSEKRKPIFVILLKKTGKGSCKKWKKNKVEVFKASDFVSYSLDRGRQIDSLYRIRVNGKWFPKGQVRFFYKSDIRNMIFKGLKFK